MLAGFNGANDNVTFSNEGSISATQDNAVDLSNSNFSTFSNSGSITAGGNYALLLDGFSGASMVISNLGSITAGTTQPGNAPAPFMALSQPLSIRFQSPRAHHPLLVRSVIRYPIAMPIAEAQFFGR